MNNRHIFIGLILAFSSFCHAQEAATDTVTSVRAEEILPESMIISEEEMMKDFASAANRTPKLLCYRRRLCTDRVLWLRR